MSEPVNVALPAPPPPADHSSKEIYIGRLDLAFAIALLICAFAAGKPEPLTFVLGLTHGLLWIFMSLACILAARLRIVSLRLAVADCRDSPSGTNTRTRCAAGGEEDHKPRK